MRYGAGRDERGMALPVALFAIVIAGAIMMGVFYVGRLEQRLGGGSVRMSQAFEAAEAGAANVMNAWTTGGYNNMAVGASSAIATTSLGGGAYYSGTIRKLSATKFLVQTDGEERDASGRVLTRQRIARLIGLNVPAININAAVTTRTGMTVSGSSQISGRDTVPPSLTSTCANTGIVNPGIRDSSGNVTTSGACSGASCITGSPRIQADPTVNTNSFTNFGSVTFAQMAAMADKTVSGTMNGLGPTTNSGPPVSCRTTDNTNWGAPLSLANVCSNYFPIIYAPGNLRLTGGNGQGILLVAGDLDLSGGVDFYGPVIVLGGVRSTGTGGHILGGLMADAANLSATLISGNSVVDFSSCTVNRALRGIARPQPFDQRGWAQIY